MIRTSILALALAGSASAAAAQAPAASHAGHPASDPHAAHRAAPADPHAGHAASLTDPHAAHRAPPAAADPHAGHAAPKNPHAAPPADPHAGHAAPPAADPHAGHGAGAASDPHAGHAAPAADPHAGHGAGAVSDPHAGHAAPPADPHAGHAVPPSDAHAGHGPAGATGADLPVGAAPPPPVIADNLADGVFGAAAMQSARAILAEEHGATRASKVQADTLEWSPDGDGYSWEVEGWYGGDLNRLAFKTEGEGAFGDGLEAAEAQVLYSRPVARYADVQVGLRYDFEPRSLAYATLAVDAMFPYWFEAEGALFLSEDGDLLARAEGSYDLRLTQRLILQPRAELEFAAQDVPEREIGSGLYKAELGLRLRYELRRTFAPYVGVQYEKVFGEAADHARAHGEDVSSARVVAGLRAWF